MRLYYGSIKALLRLYGGAIKALFEGYRHHLLLPRPCSTYAAPVADRRVTRSSDESDLEEGVCVSIRTVVLVKLVKLLQRPPALTHVVLVKLVTLLY